MKRPLIVSCAGIALLVLGACVAGSAASQQAAEGGALQAFLLGLWHGVIAPVTLIIEIVNHVAPHALPWTVRLYEARDTGMIYDIGFYLGLAGGPPILIGGWGRRG